MKRQIILSIAFSVLAVNAFAASPAQPVVSTPTPHVQVAEGGSDHLKQNRVADGGFERLNIDLKSAVIVADNRSEFGSQYQRY